MKKVTDKDYPHFPSTATKIASLPLEHKAKYEFEVPIKSFEKGMMQLQTIRALESTKTVFLASTVKTADL